MGYDGDACPWCGKAGSTRTSPHFGQVFLRACPHPFAQQVLHARKLDKLLGTFIEPWAQHLPADGILRYRLHQLRRDDYGTISGRCSTSSVFGGAQPQQIWNEEKQVEEMGEDWVVREQIGRASCRERV